MPTTFDENMMCVMKKLYGRNEAVLERQVKRYRNSIAEFKRLFDSEGDGLEIFSAPGRTEIGGNHTDHNLGRVLAGGVNLDSIAVAMPIKDKIIKFYSRGYEDPFIIDLNRLEPIKEEEGTTSSLMRGIAARLYQLGYKIGGFYAYIDSDVLPGSGLSSSASIEVLLGTILSHLYNDGAIKQETLAKVGQYAENEFFGKPCGLMDQMACAIGGFVTIDFKDVENPIVEKIDFDIGAQGYDLLVVDTGGNHSDLTEDYAAVPREMKSVAQAMGKEVCRESSMDELINNIPTLRKKVGDRAILRGMHFFTDDNRVVEQVAALKGENFDEFLKLVNESGSSSWRWLQNCYATHNPEEQGITLCLALTERFITQNGGRGACRVHGGGFAGTIQVFLPKEFTPNYIEMIEPLFGEGVVTVLSIRKYGAISIKSMSM